MKLKCRLGWHEYTKWTEKGSVTTTRINPANSANVITEKKNEVQSRKCVHCGIKKLRRERI